MAIVILDRARFELEEIIEWWRENRTAAPYLFENEFETLLAQLAAMPSIGHMSRDTILNLRASGLLKSRYVVYHRFVPDLRRVEIVSVWHMSRRDSKW
jgi:plasmid stabilization system protein ParE